MTTDLTTNVDNKSSRHHLMIGGCGSVGVAFSDYVHRIGDSVSIYARENHVERLKRDANLKYFDVNGYLGHHAIFVILSIAGCCFPMLFFGVRLLTCFVAILNLRMVPPVIAHFYSVFYPMGMKQVPIKGAISAPKSVSALDSPVSHLWLCTSSPQMHKMISEISQICEETLKTFQPCAEMPKPVFVSLTPGMTDAEFLTSNVPALKDGKISLVMASIPIVAYQHPLMSARYSFTPFLKTPSIVLFTSPDPIRINSDDDAARASTAAALSAMTTQTNKLTDPAIRRGRMLPEALFTSLVLTIEGCQWQFAGVANPWTVFSMIGGMMEMKSAFYASNADGEPKLVLLPDLRAEETRFMQSSTSRLLSPSIFGFFLVLYPILLLLSVAHMLLLPFDMERYFEYHFVKVGDQMSGYASLGIRVAARENLPHGHILSVYSNAIEARQNRLLAMQLRQANQAISKAEKESPAKQSDTKSIAPVSQPRQKGNKKTQ